MAIDIPGFPTNKLDYKVTLYNGSALLPHITTPTSSFQNGMVWTTSAGLFARINGATVGPFITTSVTTGWTPALFTAAPNATVNVARWLVNTASADGDAAIQPKGLGAYLAQVPDSTTAGGDKRGASAVDLQMVRSATTMVASGTASCIPGGSNNTASGANSMAFGANSTASAQYAIALGFGANAGFKGFAYGEGNNADGDSSSALTGRGAITRGMTATAAEGTGSNLSGSAQAMRQVGWTITSNATITEMGTDGAGGTAATVMVLPDFGSYVVKGLTIARNQATDTSKAWEWTAVIRRSSGAGTTAMVAAATVTVIATDAAMTTCALTIDADTTVGSLRRRGTGIAATNIRWVDQIYSCVQNQG